MPRGAAHVMRPAALQPSRQEIVGPILNLIEDEAHIFADDSKEEQLQSAEERDARPQRCPPWQIGTGKEEIANDLRYSDQDAEHGKKYSSDNAKSQRRLGKRADAVQCEIEQCQSTIFRLAFRALRRNERDVVDAEPD